MTTVVQLLVGNLMINPVACFDCGVESVILDSTWMEKKLHGRYGIDVEEVISVILHTAISRSTVVPTG